MRSANIKEDKDMLLATVPDVGCAMVRIQCIDCLLTCLVRAMMKKLFMLVLKTFYEIRMNK